MQKEYTLCRKETNCEESRKLTKMKFRKTKFPDRGISRDSFAQNRL